VGGGAVADRKLKLRGVSAAASILAWLGVSVTEGQSQGASDEASRLLDACIAKLDDTARRLNRLPTTQSQSGGAACASDRFRLVVERLLTARLDQALSKARTRLACETAPTWRLEVDGRIVLTGEITQPDALIEVVAEAIRDLPGLEVDGAGLRRKVACESPLVGEWRVLQPPGQSGQYVERGLVGGAAGTDRMPRSGECADIGRELEQAGSERYDFWTVDDAQEKGLVACRPGNPWYLDPREDRARIIIAR